MKIWTQDEEVARLAARFVGVKQAEFARTHGVPGGPSMLSQHIKGRKPISLDAARAYAKGFGVPLAEISPRLALLVAKAAETLDGRSNPPDSGVGAARLILDEFTVPPTLLWGYLMLTSKDKLPAEFRVAAPNDALAPRLRSGQLVTLDTRLSPMPGDCVLLRDRAGGQHLRVYRAAVGRWEAHSMHPEYPTMDSDRDGLEVLAVLVAVEARWGG